MVGTSRQSGGCGWTLTLTGVGANAIHLRENIAWGPSCGWSDDVASLAGDKLTVQVSTPADNTCPVGCTAALERARPGLVQAAAPPFFPVANAVPGAYFGHWTGRWHQPANQWEAGSDQSVTYDIGAGPIGALVGNSSCPAQLTLTGVSGNSISLGEDTTDSVACEGSDDIASVSGSTLTMRAITPDDQYHCPTWSAPCTVTLTRS